MTIQELNAEQLAEEWTERIVSRMQQANMPPQQIEETKFIASRLAKVAAEELKNDNDIPVPHTDLIITLDKKQSIDVLNMFIRTIIKISDTLREVEQPSIITWDDRLWVLESVSGEVFTFAKLVYAATISTPEVQQIIKDKKDMNKMMEHFIPEVIYRYLPENYKIKGGRTQTNSKVGIEFQIISKAAQPLIAPKKRKNKNWWNN